MAGPGAVVLGCAGHAVVVVASVILDQCNSRSYCTGIRVYSSSKGLPHRTPHCPSLYSQSQSGVSATRLKPEQTHEPRASPLHAVVWHFVVLPKHPSVFSTKAHRFQSKLVVFRSPTMNGKNLCPTRYEAYEICVM